MSHMLTQRRAEMLQQSGDFGQAKTEYERCASLITIDEIYNPMSDEPRHVAVYCKDRWKRL